MNGEGIGYKVLAVTTRKMAKAGKMDPAAAEKKARVYDFLATCDKADIYTLLIAAHLMKLCKGTFLQCLTAGPKWKKKRERPQGMI